MKTIVIWDTCGEDRIRFFVAPGDWEELDQAYLNSSDSSDEQIARMELMLYSAGINLSEGFKNNSRVLNAFPLEAFRNEFNNFNPSIKVITCGFIP
jgi:hypothetical protein